MNTAFVPKQVLIQLRLCFSQSEQHYKLACILHDGKLAKYQF